MEAKKRQYYKENMRTSYIEGNTARKLQAVPDYEREEQPYKRPSPRRQEHRQPKVLSGMNFASLLVLTVAVIATVAVCVEYLMIQNQVSKMEKSIKTMEMDLTTMTNENDAAFASINTTFDLDYVYKVAVEELGMVYPNDNTVITYEAGEEGFVRQYEDIPD